MKKAQNVFEAESGPSSRHLLQSMQNIKANFCLYFYCAQCTSCTPRNLPCLPCLPPRVLREKCASDMPEAHRNWMVNTIRNDVV